MKKWKSIVSGIAPTIATALGGPLAGTATKFLASKLLGDENATEGELEIALSSANPEQLAKLKEIDNAFKLEMERIDVDVFALEVEDKKSARDLAKFNMFPQVILSTIFIGGYFGLVYMLFSGQIKIDESIRDMANILLGVLTVNIPNIMQFWFGSSHSSSKKTEMIGRPQKP